MPIALRAWDGMAGFDLCRCEQESFVPLDDGRLVGLVCHAGCYALLIEQLKYRLKLGDVQQLAKDGSWQAHLMQGDYGGMIHYQEQVLP